MIRLTLIRVVAVILSMLSLLWSCGWGALALLEFQNANRPQDIEGHPTVAEAMPSIMTDLGWGAVGVAGLLAGLLIWHRWGRHRPDCRGFPVTIRQT